MLKRSSIPDEAQLAKTIIGELTAGEPEQELESDPKPVKNLAAVALGRLGGLKGGRARADKLSSKKRKAIAKKAAQARWNKPEK